MNRIEQIEQQRQEILKEMGMIRSMRRGSLNEQYLRVVHKGKGEAVLRGPYYVFSRSEKRKTVSMRVKSGSEVGRLKGDIKAYNRFKELCREFECLTEELGKLERSLDEGLELKKGLKSQSRRTRK